MSEECIIHIVSGGRVQQPAVIEGVTWETSRRGEPGRLTFTCIKDRTFGDVEYNLTSGIAAKQKFVEAKDGGLSFSEGAEVHFWYGKTHVFAGRVFEKRRNKDHHIEVTCYDNFRYLKNDSAHLFTGLRADQIIKRIASDLGYDIGDITNTQYVIPKFAKDDSNFLDTMQCALDLTCMSTKEIYTMFDDAGKISVKHVKDMLVPIVIDANSCEDFDYSTSIDSNTYNRIIVTGGDDGSEPIMIQDPDTPKQWGVLTKVVDNSNGGNNAELARKYLQRFNRVGRSLSINGQFGDIRVRGGSGIYLSMNLGDHIYNQTMIVDKVTHTFNENDHYMDLTLIDGRDFYA